MRLSQIQKALDERFQLYWQLHGMWTIELRAVTYTYENGNYRSRKLCEFDLREELNNIFAIDQKVKELIESQYPSHLIFQSYPDLLTPLKKAYWNGNLNIQHPPELLLQEWQLEQVKACALTNHSVNS